MKQTENYGFNVPEEHEFYDVAAQNENWEKLDATLTQIESRLQEIAEAKQSLNHSHSVEQLIFVIERPALFSWHKPA